MGAATYRMNVAQGPSFLGRDQTTILRITVRNARIRSGYLILYCVFRFPKLIALTIALFLVSANLDNVPDCPELLNSRSGPSVSLQLVHHDVAARLDTVGVAWQIFQPPVAPTLYVPDALLALSPRGTMQSLYQAADPSPPSSSVKPAHFS